MFTTSSQETGILVEQRNVNARPDMTTKRSVMQQQDEQQKMIIVFIGSVG